MHVCNAGGESGPVCVVIAVKQMPADAWFGVKVVGLSWVADIGGKGMIYFCKTRCGTKEMWADWFQKVAIATILKSNEAHYPDGILTTDGTTLMNHFSTDGEDIILSNIYTNEDVQTAFIKTNTSYSRVGAGTTGIHNACDRAYTFRETKAVVRKYRKQTR